MKILLASNGYFALKKGLKYLDKPIDEIKLAYVTTASKGVKNISYLKRHKQILLKNKIYFEEIDIDILCDNNLEKKLKKFNVVFVEGGNTFYLLKSVKKSNFDSIIKKLLDNGLFYIGSSAGAYITCPTIEMSKWKVNSKNIKHDYELTDLSAMNIVPFLLKAHFKTEQKEMLRKKIKSSKYPVKILSDGQGFLIENDNVTFIGDGKEITL